jgi:serine/threonine protein kinase
VTAALDVWALGVIAFELLSQRRAFPTATPRAAIQAALVGRKPLPWEDTAPDRAAALRPLRALRRSVLACLSRDPAARPSVRDVLRAWDHLYDTETTVPDAAARSRALTIESWQQPSGLDTAIAPTVRPVGNEAAATPLNSALGTSNPATRDGMATGAVSAAADIQGEDTLGAQCEVGAVCQAGTTNTVGLLAAMGRKPMQGGRSLRAFVA